jgi:hypothetical protein
MANPDEESRQNELLELEYEIERLILELAGRVQRRELLRLRGAGEDELEANRLEIERLRWRLAAAMRRRAAARGPRVA